MTVLLFASQPELGPLAASTPIQVAAGGLIVATADAPADLLANLTASLTDLTGTTIVASAAVTITLDSDLENDTWRYAARLVAPLTAGDYQIVWEGPEPDQTASEPVQVTIGVRPSITAVAALLRARTKIKGGSEPGTFNDLGPPNGTRPTATQVEGLIDDALDEVSGKVQDVDLTLPAGEKMGPGSAYERRYSSAVALYAAILVELSYFPEQVRGGTSPVATYQQLYDSRIRALISEGEHAGQQEGMGEGGAGSGGAGDAPADAAWAFPDFAPGGLVGWGSHW